MTGFTQAEIDKLKKDRDNIHKNLRNEARSAEEARAYISVLENSLQSRVEELGYDTNSGGSSKLLKEIANLKGQLKVAQDERDAQEQTCKTLEQDLYRLQQGVDSLGHGRNSATDHHPFSYQYQNGSSNSVSKTHDVERLEKEKAALLDYIQVRSVL